MHISFPKFLSLQCALRTGYYCYYLGTWCFFSQTKKTGEEYNNDGSFSHYFHGKNRKRMLSPRAWLTSPWEEVHHWCFLSVEQKQQQNRIILGCETMTVHCTMVQSLFAAKISDSEITFSNTIVYKMGGV